MAQSSLLTASRVPQDPELAQKWAERIRDRISSISRNMLNLESERQQLLSMLWDAGLADFVVSNESQSDSLVCRPELESQLSEILPANVFQRPDFSRRASKVSSQSVIDLLSDDGNDDQQNGSPRIASGEVLDFPPTPIVQSQGCDNENDGDLANLDPHELSFHLPPPQSVVEATSGPESKPRIYKPEEWEMVDWENIPQELLKEWMQFYGMKTTGGKAHMIRQLKEIFRYISGSSEPLPAPKDQQVSKTDIFNEFTETISSNVSLYEKMILFEPVEVHEVHSFLKSRKRPHWQISAASVKEYLDLMGAQYSNTASNSGNFGAFISAGQSRSRRQLRKSVSAP